MSEDQKQDSPYKPYLEAVASARAEASAQRFPLYRRIEAITTLLAATEVDIARAIKRINDRNLFVTDRRLLVTWRDLPAESPWIGQANLRWADIPTKARGSVIYVTWPDSRLIRRRVIQNFASMFVSTSKELKRTLRRRNMLRAVVSELIGQTRKALGELGGQGIELEPPIQLDLSVATSNDIEAHRTSLAQYTVSLLESLFTAVADLDRRLDAEISAFNMSAPRRNGALIARFLTPDTDKQKIIGPHGPIFYTRSFQGGRTLTYVKSAAGNTITRKLIRSTYNREYEEKLLLGAGIITTLRDMRQSCQNTIFNAHRMTQKALVNRHE